MGSVPLVTSFTDTRNLATFVFFGGCLVLTYKVFTDFEVSSREVRSRSLRKSLDSGRDEIESTNYRSVEFSLRTIVKKNHHKCSLLLPDARAAEKWRFDEIRQEIAMFFILARNEVHTVKEAVLFEWLGNSRTR